MRSNLLASVDVNEFQTTDAYSSLDLTNVMYNLSVHTREVESNATNWTQLVNTMRENTVVMVKEMRFRVNKYSRVFYRVGPGYRELAMFIIINQYAGFPGEGCNFSFTNAGSYS
jgi:hypothetical protein